MECNKEEAVRARGIAEQKMVKNDFEGARNIALKAKNLFPELDNISRLIAVCDVHCSALKKINGTEKDLYGILQVENVADETTIRKQYRKLALFLHPDKNNFPGAEAAFKLIGEANMILSDKGKRSVYDTKCKKPVIAPATKVQNRPGNHASYAGKQFMNPQANGMNHRQQSAPNMATRPSFWTYCPFCNIKYEYYREFVNRPLRCQNCSKLFIAYDIGAQGPVGPPPGPHFVHVDMQSANLGSNKAQTPFSQTVKREKVKVNPQKDGKSSSHFAHQTASTGGQFGQSAKTEDNGVSSRKGHKENGKEKVTKPKVNSQKPMETGPDKDTKKKRGRKMVVESSESGSEVEDKSEGSGVGSFNDSINRRKSSREKQKVFYREDAAASEFSPQKRSKIKNPSSDVEDVKKEKVSTADVDKESDKDSDASMPNGHDDDGDDDPVFVECPELEFSNFDKEKEEHCFAVDQIWACYDTVDGMPRFYVRIRKISTRVFKLRITWLESDPDNDLENQWAKEGLPVGCGKFNFGETEETKDLLMFSHQISYKNGPKKNTFIVHPQKGEIWALFKDWDINWCSEPENHTKFKFDIVEILSVDESGLSVSLLVKIKGFVSLFQRKAWTGLAERNIPFSELFRFSHRIPSTKLNGTECAGVPAGSFELDTAALPGDLDEYYPSLNSKSDPENVSKSTTPKKNINSEAKNDVLRRSPRGLKEKDLKDSNPNGKIPKSPKLCRKQEQVIHDFTADRQIWKFKKKQIWAFWESKNLNYAQIKQIETNPFKLHVSLLKSLDIRSNVCGLFKVIPAKTKELPLHVFSHIVKVDESYQNFSIYPREQQIWALCKRQKPVDCTFEGGGECEIVEVLEADESGIKVMALTHVAGYKSVFKGPRVDRSTAKIVVIPRRDLYRFFRQIPAFLFTEEKDGSLRGCWELDPEAVKGLSLCGSARVCID